MDICTLTDTAKAQIASVCKENECYAVTKKILWGQCLTLLTLTHNQHVVVA